MLRDLLYNIQNVYHKYNDVSVRVITFAVSRCYTAGFHVGIVTVITLNW